MKNKRKGREVFQAPSYWQSYSDMMAALLLLFVLIIAITLGIYKMKTTEKRTAGYCRNPDRYYWGITDEVFQLYHAGRSADRFHQFFYRCAVQI